MAARSVCWRAGRYRPAGEHGQPAVSSRASRACGGKSLTRAAASSMASGSPSSRTRNLGDGRGGGIRHGEAGLDGDGARDEEAHHLVWLDAARQVGAGQGGAPRR